MTTMLVNYWSLQEQIRHNLAAEQELSRHNVATENLTGRQISLGYAQLGEDMRHNKVLEQRVEYQNAADATRAMSNVTSALSTFGYFKDDDGNSNGSGGSKNTSTKRADVGSTSTAPGDLKDTLGPAPDPQLFGEKSYGLLDIVKGAFGLPTTGYGLIVPSF